MRRTTAILMRTVLGVTIQLLLVGCPMGRPVFTVFPLAFDFSTGLNQDTLFLTNNGAVPVTWSITGAVPPWLTVSPSSGTTVHLSSLTLAVDRGLLTIDNSHGSFVVSSSVGDFTVYVSATIGGGGGGVPIPGDTPVIRVVGNAPGTDDTHAIVQLGSTDTTATFRVENAGTGTFTWNISSNQLDSGTKPDWLVSVSPSGGTVASTATDVTVTVQRPSSLATGQHTYTLTLSHTATNNTSPVEVQIVLNRPIHPTIDIDPAQLNFGPDNDASEFFVANFGDAGTLLNFRVESDSPCWLFLTPLTGTSRVTYPPDWQRIGVTVYRGGLPSDAAGGVVTIRAYDRDDVTPVTLPVSVEKAPLSIEGAAPWMITPSRLRYVFLLRDASEVPLVLSTTDIEDGITVYENAVPLELSETGLSVSSAFRINLVVVLDYSNSMYLAAQSVTDQGAPVHADALHDIYLKTVVPTILQNTVDFPANTNIALTAFVDRNNIQLIHDFTTDRAALVAALQAFPGTTHGASAILPAVDDAVTRLYDFEQGGTGDQTTGFADAVVNAILLISDGRQTTPPAEVSDTTDDAKDSRVRIFALSWGNQPNQGLMAEVSLASDGQFYPTGTPCENGVPVSTSGEISMQQLDVRLAEFARDMSRHYVLTYTTLNENDNVPVRIESILTVDDRVIRGASRQYDLDLSSIKP